MGDAGNVASLQLLDYFFVFVLHKDQTMKYYIVCLLFALGSQSVWSLPTLYNVNNDTNEGQAVMVAIASTVIPLEDLPIFKVGLGFGLGMKEDKPQKPTNLKDIQLITLRTNTDLFQQRLPECKLTKEEFEQFNL